VETSFDIKGLLRQHLENEERLVDLCNEANLEFEKRHGQAALGWKFFQGVAFEDEVIDSSGSKLSAEEYLC